MPGGPLSSAAFFGPFGFVKLPTFLLLSMNVPSHAFNQRFNLVTASPLPSMSRDEEGAYLSAQRAFGPSSFPEGWVVLPEDEEDVPWFFSCSALSFSAADIPVDLA